MPDGYRETRRFSAHHTGLAERHHVSDLAFLVAGESSRNRPIYTGWLRRPSAKGGSVSQPPVLVAHARDAQTKKAIAMEVILVSVNTTLVRDSR